jgi:hypothetical protein
MKKLIIITIAIFSTLIATAQTAEDKQKAIDLIKARTESFNQSATPIYVKNILDVEKQIDKQNLNYRFYSFVVFGEIEDKNVHGGSMNSYSNSISKPFIYYSIEKENGRTVIWVISGHNGW